MKITLSRILICAPAVLLGLLILARFGIPLLGLVKLLALLTVLLLCALWITAALTKDQPETTDDDNLFS
jgi:hypothetical protein